MPECVSVSEFVQEVQEDWSSPTTSSFTSNMSSCRNTVYLLEEVRTWATRAMWTTPVLSTWVKWTTPILSTWAMWTTPVQST